MWLEKFHFYFSFYHWLLLPLLNFFKLDVVFVCVYKKRIWNLDHIVKSLPNSNFGLRFETTELLCNHISSTFFCTPSYFFRFISPFFLYWKWSPKGMNSFPLCFARIPITNFNCFKHLSEHIHLCLENTDAQGHLEEWPQASEKDSFWYMARVIYNYLSLST